MSKLWTERLPYAMAAFALLIGAIMGHCANPAADAGAAATAAETAADAETAAETDVESESESDADADADADDDADADPDADLAGPDLGTVLIAGASDAHALAIVGARLVWFVTEGAKLSSAKLDGSDVVTQLSLLDEERYGGAFAHDARGIYWTVASMGEATEPIHFLETAALGKKNELGPPLFEGSSPDLLTPLGGKLYWTDLGNVMGAEGKLAARDRRIATMTGCGGTLYWIEAPFAGDGAHALVSYKLGEEPRIVARPTPRARADLQCRARDGGDDLFWSESDGDRRHALVGRNGKLADTGVVSALTLTGNALVWAEIHGSGDKAVSLLRTLAIGEAKSAPQHIGRDAGTITALAVHAGQLYWSGKRGIARAPLDAGAKR